MSNSLQKYISELCILEFGAYLSENLWYIIPVHVITNIMLRLNEIMML